MIEKSSRLPGHYFYPPLYPVVFTFADVSVARDGVEIVGFGESRGGVDMGSGENAESKWNENEKRARQKQQQRQRPRPRHPPP